MSLAARIVAQVGDFTLDVALDVEAGKTIAIVGPNGAGKTTLLRTLAGLQSLADGRIELDGVVLDQPAAGVYVAPERRPVGVVFQDNALFPHLDARDNIAFGLRAHGQRRSDARRLATEWLDRVGLVDRADAKPRQLSGGQAQRVALARALALEPALLLLDEPLAALDATTRNEMRVDLRRHLSSFPGIRLIVTHDPLDAAALADEVIVLDRGRVAQTGTPTEITTRPRSQWVAELIGTNLFAGHVSPTGTLLLEGGGELTTADRLEPGPTFAVVHPRAVSLHRTRPLGSTRNTWSGRIASIEPFGDRLRVRLEGAPPVVAEITVSAAAEMGLHTGEEAWVAVKAAQVEIYPRVIGAGPGPGRCRSDRPSGR